MCISYQGWSVYFSSCYTSWQEGRQEQRQGSSGPKEFAHLLLPIKNGFQSDRLGFTPSTAVAAFFRPISEPRASTKSYPSMLGFRKSKPILNPHQDVPGEVLGHIFAFASTTTLLSCALVSRQARYFAEPQLYKHIDLFNCPIRSAYFLRTIWLRQELLRYVITFRLAERYEKPPGLPPQLWDHLQGHENDFNASYARRSYRVHKLEVAMHLTKAEDITHTWEYRTLEKTLGNQPAWPSLTSFTLLSTREIDYASLLDAIPMIKRLDIGSSSLLWNLERVDRISAHHVLLLEELICSAEAARILVPTRPIRQLVMFITKASGESLGDLIPQVAQSSDTIRLLGLVIKAMKAPGLQVMMSQIGKWLPDVEELYLHMKFRLVSYEQKFLMAEFMSEVGRNTRI